MPFIYVCLWEAPNVLPEEEECVCMSECRLSQQTSVNLMSLWQVAGFEESLSADGSSAGHGKEKECIL